MHHADQELRQRRKKCGTSKRSPMVPPVLSWSRVVATCPRGSTILAPLPGLFSFARFCLPTAFAVGWVLTPLPRLTRVRIPEEKYRIVVPREQPCVEIKIVASSHNDTSKMETDFGRDIAAEINRSAALSALQSRRLVCVLNEYYFFEDGIRLDLAEEAIIWTFAALASHSQAEDCKASFFSGVEVVYSLTDHAKQALNDSSVRSGLAARLNDILSSSLETLAIQDKENPRRLAAEFLHSLRTTVLEHTPPPLLRELIIRCVILCNAVHAVELGYGSDTESSEAILRLSSACSEAHAEVYKMIESGELVVQKGIIVRAKDTSP